jgi:hypothetical protein
MRPSEIDVPKEIQYLATANRYKPDKPNRFLNVVEGLFSGEGIGEDKRGAEACLQGLSNVLMESPRYKYAQLNVELLGTGTANFPDPLSPTEVKRLCEIGKADALVTIEAFDSDSKLDTRTGTRKETVNNVTRDVTIFTVNAGINVNVGWRMYRKSDGMIVDEFRMFETINFSRDGKSREDAISRLPNRDAMISEIGNIVGKKYASRISPIWLWVSRDYFGKVKNYPEMGEAVKLVRVENWEGAARIWNQLSAGNDPKITKKAMYNMALACEVLGDLKRAVEWTEMSYKAGLQKALTYNRILRQRVFEQERLNKQLQK